MHYSAIFKFFFSSPSPATISKVQAMWPYLNDESKITFFLESTDQKKLSKLTHLMNELCVLALESENPYIRYLAAKKYEFNSTWSRHLDQKVRELITNDSHQLVRHIPHEIESSLLGPKKEDILSLFDHQARLVRLQSGEMEAERFANLIRHYCLIDLPDQRISEREVYELVHTYLSSDKFIWRHTHDSQDGWGSYYQYKGLKSLWELILDVPEVVSFLLLEMLPSLDSYNHDIIPYDLMEKMPDNFLQVLLSRSDVIHKEFRKKKFFKICNESTELPTFLLLSLTSNNFQLKFQSLLVPDETNSEDEFLQILRLPYKKSLETIDFIVSYLNCSPVILIASCDYLEFNNMDDDWCLEEAKSKKEEIIEDFLDNQLDEELARDLRLYALAKAIMPWGEKKPESHYLIDTNDLCFLLSHIKWGKTWETFKAFRNAWFKQYGKNKSKDNILANLGISI